MCDLCIIDHSRIVNGKAGLRSADGSDFYGTALSHRTGSSTLVVVVVVADGLRKTKKLLSGKIYFCKQHIVIVTMLLIVI